jgi:ankyrin repeat protein
MPYRELPARPNLEHFKKQAKLLQREMLRAEATAIDRFREARVSVAMAAPKLADALHVIAREYGFDNWAKLKAHVGSLSEDPMEALTAAVQANDASLLRQVLERYPVLKTKLDESLPNYGFDEPAIVSAVQKNNRDMVEALLDAGANINARTRWWAGSFGVLDFSSPELTPYLLERGAVVDVHAAARLGMFDRLKELIEADPTLVHVRGGDGQTPLHFASSIEIAGYLLDRGAEIDARDVDHESTAAQYMAGCRPRRPEVARYLISRGAQTDILMAAAVGDLELVRQYLDEDPASVRVSVSEKDFPKRDPRSGGSIYIYSFGWSKTPHMLAREFGHEEVFRLLMQRSPLGLRFAQACEVGDEALAKELLAKHPDVVRTLSARASRRIISAAMRNNTRAVRMMLSAGWPADVRGEYDQSPLHWASWHGNVEVVRDLLARDAPVEVLEQQYKFTPLGWALHGSEHSWHRETGDYLHTVEALLMAGAKLTANVDDLKASEEVLEVLRRHRGQDRRSAFDMG